METIILVLVAIQSIFYIVDSNIGDCKTYKGMGPIQTEWINALISNPEEQIKSQLGRMVNGRMGYCCLGKAEQILCNHKRISIKFNEYSNRLYSNGSSNYETLDNYEEIALFSKRGDIRDIYFGDNLITASLAYLNDNVYSWPEIARIIIANPDKVFTHKV